MHILLLLKRVGIVRSIRGAQGGYMLGRSPDDITLLNIVRAIDGGVLDPLPASDGHGNDLKRAWREVAEGIEQVLDNVTVRDLMARAQTSMYYI
mgnify:FL=1